MPGLRQHLSGVRDRLPGPGPRLIKPTARKLERWAVERRAAVKAARHAARQGEPARVEAVWATVCAERSHEEEAVLQRGGSLMYPVDPPACRKGLVVDGPHQKRIALVSKEVSELLKHPPAAVVVRHNGRDYEARTIRVVRAGREDG